jgi:hypothetical protein
MGKDRRPCYKKNASFKFKRFSQLSADFGKDKN